LKGSVLKEGGFRVGFKMSHSNIKLIEIALGQMKESVNEHVKVLGEAIK